MLQQCPFRRAALLLSVGRDTGRFELTLRRSDSIYQFISTYVHIRTRTRCVPGTRVQLVRGAKHNAPVGGRSDRCFDFPRIYNKQYLYDGILLLCFTLLECTSYAICTNFVHMASGSSSAV